MNKFYVAEKYKAGSQEAIKRNIYIFENIEEAFEFAENNYLDESDISILVSRFETDENDNLVNIYLDKYEKRESCSLALFCDEGSYYYYD